MKHSYLILGILLGCLFSACKPDFDLNAPYKDVTVVYGILNYQDPVHYIKIYKGFQSHETGGVYLDAQNPDSIYYNVGDIDVILKEYNNKGNFIRDIRMEATNEHPKDEGIFYYDEKRIFYKTEEEIKKENSYKIVITNNKTGKVTESQGMTPIVGDFKIKTPNSIDMTADKIAMTFEKAPLASDSCYEFIVKLHYFEVDKTTHNVVKEDSITKVITTVGEYYEIDKNSGYYVKKFSATFYDDLAEKLVPNAKVIRYIGFKEGGQYDTQLPIKIDGWAAGTSMKNYLLSNKPTSSFVQINTIYTNLQVTGGDGLAFGFFSSRVKSPTQECSTRGLSEDSLVYGSKTRHLGFRFRKEYHP
jgi:hypothetical protein